MDKLCFAEARLGRWWDWLFFCRCLNCGRSSSGDWTRSGLVCPACRRQLPVLPPGTCSRCALPPDRCSGIGCAFVTALPDLDSATAATIYGGPARRLVFRFKYGDTPELARPLGECMVQAWLGRRAPNLVIPIPLHPDRLALRGYNQAALLARSVARDLGRPCRELLSRTHQTHRQHELSPEQRRANLANAFVLRPGARVAGRSVLLIDDILTTGATVGTAAGILKANGAAAVHVLTFCRTLP